MVVEETFLFEMFYSAADEMEVIPLLRDYLKGECIS